LATCIIPTSLPPSPIANVIPPNFYFTNFTIDAFYLGLLRQNIIDEAQLNIYMYWGFELLIKADMMAPYMMIVM
jgi:hypothetical protein